jgi:hypothetical protein
MSFLSVVHFHTSTHNTVKYSPYRSNMLLVVKTYYYYNYSTTETKKIPPEV